MKKLSRLLLICIDSVGGQTIDLNAQEYETIDESVFDEETVKGLKLFTPWNLLQLHRLDWFIESSKYGLSYHKKNCRILDFAFDIKLVQSI